MKQLQKPINWRKIWLMIWLIGWLTGWLTIWLVSATSLWAFPKKILTSLEGSIGEMMRSLLKGKGRKPVYGAGKNGKYKVLVIWLVMKASILLLKMRTPTVWKNQLTKAMKRSTLAHRAGKFLTSKWSGTTFDPAKTSLLWVPTFSEEDSGYENYQATVRETDDETANSDSSNR